MEGAAAVADRFRADHTDRPTWRLLAPALLVVTVGGWAAGLSVTLAVGGDLGSVPFPTSVSAFALIGSVVAWQRPRHLIGWLLLLIGTTVVLGWAAETVAYRGFLADDLGSLTVFGAWYGEWYWVVYLHLMLVQLPLRFPTGSAPNRRWRAFARFDLAWMTGTVAVAMMEAELAITDGTGTDVAQLVNPVGLLPIGDIEQDSVAGLSIAPIMLFAVVALVCLALRFRRSQGVERRQLEVALTGFGIVALIYVLNALVDLLLGGPLVGIAEVAVNLVVPASLGVAVLRFRLWDLDRLISRTLSYALVSLVLVGVYAAVVLGAQTALGPQDAPDVVIAGATLLSAALARPVLARMRRLVDRRFDRRGYDAQRVVDVFGQRLRDEVDLHQVSAALLRSVEQTVRPAAVTVWFATGAPAPWLLGSPEPRS